MNNFNLFTWLVLFQGNGDTSALINDVSVVSGLYSSSLKPRQNSPVDNHNVTWSLMSLLKYALKIEHWTLL